MNGDGTFKDKEARPGSPFKGMPTLTISTKDIPANAFRPDPVKIPQLPGIEFANHHGMPWSKLRAAWNALSAVRLGGDGTLAPVATEISKMWLMCGGISAQAAQEHLDTMAAGRMPGDTGDNLAQAICWFPHNLVTGPKEDVRVDDPGDDDYDCFCYIPGQTLRCQWMAKVYDTFKVTLNDKLLGVLKEAFEALSQEKLTSPTAFEVRYWVLATYPHGFNPKTGTYHEDWGGKPLWQKRVLTAGDVAYIQGSEVAVKGKTMFERRQASRK